MQQAKKVMLHSLELVDLAIRLVNSVLHLPSGQMNFLQNSHYRRTVINPAHPNFFQANQNDYRYKLAAACPTGKL